MAKLKFKLPIDGLSQDTYTKTEVQTLIDNAVKNVKQQMMKKINIMWNTLDLPIPYVTFSSTEALSINCTKYWDGLLEYSFDTETWQTFTGSKITSSDGVIYMRGTNNTVITGSNGNPYVYKWTFTTTGDLSCTGNIENLLDYQTVTDKNHPTMGNYCFAYLFVGATNLIEAPTLPATTLSNGCYFQMFYGCTKLTSITDLPATTLTENCYGGMFYGCTALNTIINLSATTLASGCYTAMFQNCTALTTIHLSKTIEGNSNLTYFPGSNCTATVYYDL